MRRTRVLVVALASSTVFACRGKSKFVTGSLTPAQLAGVYVREAYSKRGTDVVVIASNGTFSVSFVDAKGIRSSFQGKWSLDRDEYLPQHDWRFHAAPWVDHTGLRVPSEDCDLEWCGGRLCIPDDGNTEFIRMK